MLSDLVKNYKIYVNRARESNGALRMSIDQCSGKLHAINTVFCTACAIKFIFISFNQTGIRPQFTSYILDTFTKKMCRQVEGK